MKVGEAMKIKRLEIYGYGKWVDQTFDLNNGLQIFLGENEAGKSTLMSFIHSILFGFPTRNSTLLRYEPLESSRYGGKIIVDDSQLGEVIIERIHGKVTGDVTVTLEDGSTGSDDLLARLLKGIDRESYQSIFSFSLTEIENVHQLNKDKLSRYLLNIGAHSTDYYLDLVDDFQKSAYDLYRPSGRIPPLNKELAIIKKQEQQLKKIEAQNESYLDLINQHNEQNKELKIIEQKITNLEQKLIELDEFEKDLHLLKEIQQLNNEIKATKLPPLKEDGPYLLEENKKKKNEIKEQLRELQEGINQIKQNLVHVDLIENYQEYEQEIKKLEENLPDKVEELETLKQIEAQLQKHHARQQDLQIALKLPIDNQPIEIFTLTEQDSIRELVRTHEQLDLKINTQNQELELLAAKIQQKNEQADYFEELMWAPEELAQVEKQIKNQGSVEIPTKTHKRGSRVLIMGLMGISLLVSSFFTSSLNPFFLMGSGILVLLLTFIYYRNHNTRPEKNDNQLMASENILTKEYTNQLNLQTDWQKLLAEIDTIQGEYQNKKKEIETNEYLQKEAKQKWRTFLNSHFIPPVHVLENAERIINEVEEFKQLEDEIENLTSQYEKIKNKLEVDFLVLKKIIPNTNNGTIAEKIHRFRQYLKEVNSLIDSEQTKMNQLNAQKQKEKELLNEQEKLVLAQKHLFDTAGVDTEEKFYLVYDKQRELEKKKNRVLFLSENTPAFDRTEKLPTQRELANQKAELKIKLEQHRQKSRMKIDERAKTQVTIQNLEKDGRYAEALQEFENQKARNQSLVDDWISDKLAAAIIQSTLNQVTKERFEEIMVEINAYFSYLTNQRYTNILFKEDELYVQDDQGRVIAVKTLSRGTAEPLYVAIRFAYIIKMQDVIKLPIIMDDPFVNFDSYRKGKMHRLLNHLSDKMQIIYFSFDSSLATEFTEQEVIDLRE